MSRLAICSMACLIALAAFCAGWAPGSAQETTLAAVLAADALFPQEELLLEITLPAEELPRGDDISAGLGHVSIPPGTRSTWEPQQPYCCPGVQVEYVVAGTYAVRAEDPVRVERAGGAVEEIPAGVEAVLGPGDALVFRNETVVEAANTGETPVDLLSWTLIDDPNSTFSGHLLPGWLDHDIDVKFNVNNSGPYGVSVPAGAAMVRLRRVELAPDATFPGPPSGVTSLAVTLRQNAAGPPVLGTVIGTQSDGTIKNVGQAAGTAYVLTFEPADPEETSSPTP